MNSVPFKGESHTTGSFGSPEQGQMVDWTGMSVNDT